VLDDSVTGHCGAENPLQFHFFAKNNFPLGEAFKTPDFYSLTRFVTFRHSLCNNLCQNFTEKQYLTDMQQNPVKVDHS
jgi:hypothetical protein